MEYTEQIFKYFISNINNIQLILIIIGAIMMLAKNISYLVFFVIFDLLLIFEGIYFDRILSLILGVVFLLLSFSQMKQFFGNNK